MHKVTDHQPESGRTGLGAAARRARRTGGLVMIAAVVLLALNLRPAVNALGVVIPELQAATGISGTTAGLLTALPTMCFAVMGFAVSGLASKMGARQAVTLSLVVLMAGQLLRATGSLPALFIGSVLALAAITFGNVLLPGLIRQYFPTAIAPMTALYTTFMMIGQTLGAGVTLPVEHALGGGWQLGIGMWAATAAIALVPWVTALTRAPGRRRSAPPTAAKSDGTTHDDAADAAAASAGAATESSPAVAGAGAAGGAAAARAIPLRRLVRAPHAWAMAVFFGTQSLQAYVVFGWVPAVLTAAGMSQDTAGGMLAIATAMGIPISAVVPTLLGTFRRHEVFVIAFVAALVAGYTWLIVAPVTATWLIAVLIGIGMGSFPMALTLLAMRAHTPQGTTALSGFGQSVGYLIASIGPVGFGFLHDLTDGYTASLIALIATLVPMLIGGLVVVRHWKIEDDLGPEAAA